MVLFSLIISGVALLVSILSAIGWFNKAEVSFEVENDCPFLKENVVTPIKDERGKIIVEIRDFFRLKIKNTSDSTCRSLHVVAEAVEEWNDGWKEEKQFDPIILPWTGRSKKSDADREIKTYSADLASKSWALIDLVCKWENGMVEVITDRPPCADLRHFPKGSRLQLRVCAYADNIDPVFRFIEVDTRSGKIQTKMKESKQD